MSGRGRGGMLAAALVAGGYLVATHGGLAQGGAVTSASVQSSVATGQRMAAAYGWTGGEWTCLNELWTRESGWNVSADNPASGAYGIPQSLPADKMASAGADWQTDPVTQIQWGLDYLKGRYGDPCTAWSHETSAGWY